MLETGQWPINGWMQKEPFSSIVVAPITKDWSEAKKHILAITHRGTFLCFGKWYGDDDSNKMAPPILHKYSTNVMWSSTALVNMQNQCIEKEPATSFGDCCDDDGKD